MITAEMVKVEIKLGLSAVCAWCEHFHEAKMRGKVMSCGRRECGGPAQGRAFPSYKGPMKERLSTMCFICGKDASAGIWIGDGIIGVCQRRGPGGKTHLDMFKEMMEKPGKRLVVNEIVVPVVGGDV